MLFLSTSILFILSTLVQPWQTLTFHADTISMTRRVNYRARLSTTTATANNKLLAKRSSESTTAKDGGKQQKKVEKKEGLLSASRRRQLGVADDEDEYDLSVALNANTDPLITKLIAGSAILAIFALLIAGVVIPSLSDYGGEGVCVPILTGGRC